MKNILIIDDDRDFRFLLKHQLKELGFNSFECATRDNAFEILASEEIHLVLCDLNLKKESGKETVSEMKIHFPTIPVIIITGYSNVRSAVELMRLGAVDYLLKPLVPEELVSLMKKRVFERNMSPIVAHVSPDEVIKSAKTLASPEYIFSDSESSQYIIKQIDLVAPTNFSVIIYGESGSGKEAFAQSIHKKSKRSNNPFLAIDCGALSPELSASILFGHEKGAFTGADGVKQGAFELAHSGTVFLDEITNLPYEIQVSLLRVMQESARSQRAISRWRAHASTARSRSSPRVPRRGPAGRRSSPNGASATKPSAASTARSKSSRGYLPRSSPRATCCSKPATATRRSRRTSARSRMPRRR